MKYLQSQKNCATILLDVATVWSFLLSLPIVLHLFSKNTFFDETMNLEEENKILKQKLALSKSFIEREILGHRKQISSQKISFETEKQTDNFFKTDNTALIKNSLETYFGEDIFYRLPQECTEQMISAELVFYSIQDEKVADGFSVLASYFKAIDILIEEEVVKPFRRFAQKEHTKLLKNDLVEKNLYRVVYQGHHLSFGRLFQVLTIFPEDIQKGTYAETFFRFLEKYKYIKNILTHKKFLELYKQIQATEVNSTARHTGVVDFETTKYVRGLLIGNLQDKNSFLYKLAQIIEIVC